MKTTEFPSIEALVNSSETSNPWFREVVEEWHTLSPELQSMVPHIAQLIVEAMGGETAWSDRNEVERNIMSYTAVSLLAEAQKRAAIGT